MLVDDRTKGIPGGTAPFELATIAEMNWNLLREDLPLPCAVLKESALVRNSQWMSRFLAESGIALCPHGKTTMSPELFDRQLHDGAWGITAATISQVQVYRRFGLKRIFLANQLIGRQAIRFISDELARDPEFDFYCLVDSLASVEQLSRNLTGGGRPLQVLVEVGQPGGRTGARSLDGAMAVARRVAGNRALALRGVECYEGIMPGNSPAAVDEAIGRLFALMTRTAQSCAEEDLFAPGAVILSAGGSAHYDLAAAALASAPIGRRTLRLLRSGCYLTHDSGWLEAFFARMRERSPAVAELPGSPTAALEVWAYVQSRPEPGLAIVTLGKRDVSYDLDLPKPERWFRPGTDRLPVALGPGYRITGLNDQHGYLTVPADTPLAVGHMVGFGISHPCTTFDKWRFMPIVDDDYTVTSAISTHF